LNASEIRSCTKEIQSPLQKKKKKNPAAWREERIGKQSRQGRTAGGCNEK
jgi:hypothetical protein